jgi:anaerobic selenocysteine-containing dehydrogenase
MGTSVQELGTVTTWLIDLLNVLTGRLDVEGGVMFPSPAVDLTALARLTGQTGLFDRWKSRVSHLPESNGELPVAAFAEEMETGGEGRIRALVTHAGNPVLSLPNGRRIERALEGLELMVSIDIYLNETTRHAHFLLPSSFGLERDHYPMLFGGLAVRNFARYAPALLPRPAGTRHDWEILLGLAARIERAHGGVHAAVGASEEALLSRLGPRGLLGALLRLGDRGITLGDLDRAPHGVDLGPLEPRLPGLLATKSGKIRLAPPRLVEDLARLRSKLRDAARAPAGELQLIGRRTLRSNNSWMHNSPRLVKGKDRCTLLMHPDDARERGLGPEDRVAVTSRTGSIVVPLAISDEVMRGVVSLPHGFGHDRPGARLSVAREHAGASANDVTDDALVDAVSGASALNGVPVVVTRAEP